MSIQSFSDFVIAEAAKVALKEKAEKNGVSVEVLHEVYDRGIVAWSEDTNKTPQQYAFNRVDSFLAGGLAAKLDKDLYEARNIENEVEYHVVHAHKTQSVIRKHKQREKAFLHANHVKGQVHTVSNSKVVSRHDHRGRKIDADGHIAESKEYIENRQALHNAHSEVSRQLAGKERDPELRRLDLHRSKRHDHASRVLEILKTTAKTRKKK